MDIKQHKCIVEQSRKVIKGFRKIRDLELKLENAKSVAAMMRTMATYMEDQRKLGVSLNDEVEKLSKMVG